MAQVQFNENRILSPKTVVEQLRVEAAKSTAFNAVMHIFAVRERARQQVTLSSLMLTMTKEGFKFTKMQYEDVLKALATIGLGTVDYDSQGRLRALKNIKMTLQSIGLAAVAKRENLDKYTSQNTFTKLPNLAPVAPLPPTQPVKEINHKVQLTVDFEGNVVTFDVPKQTTKEVGNLLAELFKKKA